MLKLLQHATGKSGYKVHPTLPLPLPQPPFQKKKKNCDKRTVDRVVKFAEHYQLNYMHCANLKPFHIFLNIAQVF